ncbi:NAD-dependent aldehyde dehydrogenase (plasmid) [Sinorhizobium meliloti GR4]|nr:NAD-dependent aldehyde dehydrogenase [Sinorhizobium meliloti GR4]
MFALAGAAGFAEGVLNLVYASEGDVTGRELCSNPKVRKISFTGSTEVGRLLMRQCSDQIRADQLRALRQRSLHRLR